MGNKIYSYIPGPVKSSFLPNIKIRGRRVQKTQIRLLLGFVDLIDTINLKASLNEEGQDLGNFPDL